MFRLFAAALAFILSVGMAAADPLFDAVTAGDTATVERLLASGAKVDSRAADQATPLIGAALSGQLETVQLLLAKGADVMARNYGGFTPLHAAAYSGSVPVAELLLKSGAVLDDAANKAGVTPLMVAGEENHLAVAELLLAKGADVGHGEIHGYLPITRAVFKGNKDIIRLFKRHGAACPPAKILGGESWYQKCLEVGD